MPLSKKSLAEKPYNICLNCVHIGKSCDGPNFLAMSPERLSEWASTRKDFLELTNLDIANECGLSEATVARFISGKTKDLSFITVQLIIRVLINGEWGKSPCVLTSVKIDPAAEHARQESDARCRELEHRLELMSTESQKKIDFLREKLEFAEKQLERKDKMIAKLMSLQD